MKTQKRSKQLKQIETQSQRGRSMVEMLGVLAIIGVLSIGGIVGYRWGMDKHIANQILYEMNLNSAQLAMLLQRGNSDGVTLSLGSPYDDKVGKFKGVDYGFDYGCEEEVAGELHKCFKLDETKYFISALNLSERIANMVIESAPNLQYYVDYTETVSDEVENTTDVTIFFDINANASESLPDSETTDKCESNADCRDDKPYCDTNNGNTCKSCYEAFGEDKPYWNGTSCAPCPSGTWNVSKNMCIVDECATNADCQALKGNNDYYCYFSWSSSCSEQSGKGTCKLKTPDGTITINKGQDSEKTFIVKDERMSWWSAKNFCYANGKELASISDLDCKNITEGTIGYCYQEDGKTISSTVTALQEKFGSYTVWLYELYDSCHPYSLVRDSGGVEPHHHQDFPLSALCE